MKRLMFAALLLIIIQLSCATKHFALGMSEQDFLIHNHSATRVSSAANETVYKLTDAGLGHLPSLKYYHFKNDKLVKFDGETEQPGLSYVGLQ